MERKTYADLSKTIHYKIYLKFWQVLCLCTNLRIKFCFLFCVGVTGHTGLFLCVGFFVLILFLKFSLILIVMTMLLFLLLRCQEAYRDLWPKQLRDNRCERSCFVSHQSYTAKLWSKFNCSHLQSQGLSRRPSFFIEKMLREAMPLAELMFTIVSAMFPSKW